MTLMRLLTLLSSVCAVLMLCSSDVGQKTPLDQVVQEALSEWQNFKIIYKKHYNDTASEDKRRKIFVRNFIRINRHNQLAKNGLRSFEMGINHFADLDPEEFAKLNGFRGPTSNRERRVKKLTEDYPVCDVYVNKIRMFDEEFHRQSLTTSYAAVAQDCNNTNPEYTILAKRVANNTDELSVQLTAKVQGNAMVEMYRVSYDDIRVLINGQLINDKRALMKYNIYKRVIEVAIQLRDMLLEFDGYVLQIVSSTSSYKGRQCGLCGPIKIRPSGLRRVRRSVSDDLPDSIDWRERGIVSPVKNQGDCGSCWSFSVTGALEGQMALKTGKLVQLSEQNLIDCSRKQGNRGCHGGFMNQSFDYIRENGGIDTESSYPYEGKDSNCRFNASNVGGVDRGYVDVLPRADEHALKEAVATIGPISVAIGAAYYDFAFYKGGIYYSHYCLSDIYTINHAVLVVVYGSRPEDGGDFWIVKNSWSENWGMQGYVLMSRNRDNNCGIASAASYPLV